MGLPEVIRQLEESAPRLYSRWSPRAWREACQGPAATLWEALAAGKDAEDALANYLYLLREGVGLQRIASGEASLEFLPVALCEVVPRLLPQLPPEQRAERLAQLWNIGERLVGKPAWLGRYLAIRLGELRALAELETWLGRVLSEGLDEGPPSRWKGPFRMAQVDPTRFDQSFLPGPVHLGTPSLACVHDRRKVGRQIAVLLRRGAPLCLGLTPCLGGEAAPLDPRAELALSVLGWEQPLSGVASNGGVGLFSQTLSQRLWVAESDA